jgi:hypothetical protein
MNPHSSVCVCLCSAQLQITAHEVIGSDGGPAVEVEVWAHHHGTHALRGTATLPISLATHQAEHQKGSDEGPVPAGVDFGPLSETLSAATAMASLDDLNGVEDALLNAGDGMLEPEQVRCSTFVRARVRMYVCARVRGCECGVGEGGRGYADENSTALEFGAHHPHVRWLGHSWCVPYWQVDAVRLAASLAALDARASTSETPMYALLARQAGVVAQQTPTPMITALAPGASGENTIS